MNTLMHICCAPCANRPIARLREEGVCVTGFWFNPNIHPYTEYQARKRTLEEYSKEIGMKLVIGGSYDLRPFITAVAGDIDGRCAYCYRVRMEKTAQYAAENGYDSFTTSLLISPYQNHEAIAAAARQSGRWGRSTGWSSSTGTSAPCSRRASSSPGTTAFTCRNTAAAFSARRTATWPPSGRKRPTHNKSTPDGVLLRSLSKK